MIRINLLREPKTSTASSMHAGRLKVPVAIGAILLIASSGMGFWYYSLSQEKATIQEQLTQLRQEKQRLKRIEAQLKRSEAQKRLLDERVALIEELKKNQRGPVSLMSSVIGAMPDEPRIWLTSLVQKERRVDIEGEAFDVPSIAQFIANLNSSAPFRRVDLEFWEDQGTSIKFRLNCNIRL